MSHLEQDLELQEIIGIKTMQSFVKSFPELENYDYGFIKHFPAYLVGMDDVQEGSIEFMITFWDKDNNLPEVTLPDTEGLSQIDALNLKGILIKQQLLKTHELLRTLDKFSTLTTMEQFPYDKTTPALLVIKYEVKGNTDLYDYSITKDSLEDSDWKVYGWD